MLHCSNYCILGARISNPEVFTWKIKLRAKSLSLLRMEDSRTKIVNAKD